MEERRKSNRKYLTFFSRVMDHKTGLLFGYLADLTTGGAMLIGDKPLAPGAVFHLCMDLPEEFAPREQLDFKARIVWSRPDDEADFHRAGLLLLDVPQEDMAILIHLLRNYGSPTS